MSPAYLKARTIERERVARIDYRYLRSQWRWSQGRWSQGRWSAVLLRALVARERWSVLHSLLREPDWVEELALLAGGAA